jgi:class 3 adenylate cyclase
LDARAAIPTALSPANNPGIGRDISRDIPDAIGAHWTRQIVPLAVLVLVAAVMLAAPVEALRWYRTPFVGALFEPNQVVSRIPGTGWAARAAGAEWPDRLVAVDDKTILPTDDLSESLSQIGSSVRLTFQRRSDLSRYTIVVPVSRPSFQDFGGLFLVPYLVGLVFLGLGLWVYTLRWRLRAGRAYLFFCCAAAVIAAAFLDMNSTHVLVRLWVAAVPVAGIALAQLALVFPTDVPWVRRWPSLRHLLWLPCAAAFAWSQWQLYQPVDPWAYIGSWLINYSLVTLSLLLFAGLMALRLQRSDSPMVRQQSRVTVLGGLLAFAPVFVLYLLPTLLQPSAPARFVAILYFPSLVVFPLAVAYSIIRYRMPELDRLLSRQVAYGLMTVVVVVLYFGLVAAVGALLGNQVAVNDPLVISLALFAMVAGFNPLRAGAQAVVDRLFFRQRADYRLSLQEYSRELSNSTGLDQVLRRLLERAAANLGPEQVLVYLHDEAARQFVAHGPSGPSVEPPFAAGGAVANVLRAASEPWHLSPEPGEPASTSAEIEVLTRLGLQVLAPLRTEAGLLGWLALGPKRSGEPYSGDDLAFLGALASQSALAVENARLFVSQRHVEADRERIRQTFGRVVAPRVRDRLLSEPASLNLAGTRQTITTLFADVRGFTTLSEHMRPEELFTLLNEHLTLAAQAVLDHEGTIDKFMGDAIMALFNVPDPQPDHTLRAVKAALDMQERLAEHRRTHPGERQVHLGAAITVGDAIVGNVGTPELFNYTAVGDTVNLAKRLQENAEAGQILLNTAAYERVRLQVDCRPLAAIQVKGRAAFEQIFEVMGLLEPAATLPAAQATV